MSPPCVGKAQVSCMSVSQQDPIHCEKSLPRKEGPTNIVSLGPQERENLEKKNVITTSVVDHIRSKVYLRMKVIFSLLPQAAILGAMLQQSSIPVI